MPTLTRIFDDEHPVDEIETGMTVPGLFLGLMELSSGRFVAAVSTDWTPAKKRPTWAYYESSVGDWNEFAERMDGIGNGSLQRAESSIAFFRAKGWLAL